MLTGDSLSVFLQLGGLAFAAAIGAFSLTGVKARALWAVAALLGAASIVWALFSVELGISPALLFQVLLATMPPLVIGTVVLLLKGVRPTETTTPDRPPVVDNAALAREVLRVVQNARVTLHNDRSVRGVERATHGVRAMQVTLEKTKGIRFLKPTQNAELNLEGALRIMEQVAPLLKAGHDEEARRASEEWVASVGPEAEA